MRRATTPPSDVGGSGANNVGIIGGGARGPEDYGPLRFGAPPPGPLLSPPAAARRQQQPPPPAALEEEFMDNKNIKAAVHRNTGMKPRQAWDSAMQRQQAYQSVVSSSSATLCSFRCCFWFLLVASLLVLVTIAGIEWRRRAVAASTSSVNDATPRPLGAAAAEEEPALSLPPPAPQPWLATWKKQQQQQQSTTPIQWDTFIDAKRLEKARGKDCEPPESVSAWVCGSTGASSATAALDKYLLQLGYDSMDQVMRSSNYAPLVQARRFCHTSGGGGATSTDLNPLWEKLRRQTMLVNDWASLSQSFGQAAAWGVDAFLCLGANRTVRPCASLSTVVSASFRGALSLRSWLLNPMPGQVASRFERQYSGLDAQNFVRGVHDAWEQTLAMSTSSSDNNIEQESWTLVDTGYLQRLNLTAGGTVEEWKGYLIAWIHQMQSTALPPKLPEELEPYVLQDITPEVDSHYLPRMIQQLVAEERNVTLEIPALRYKQLRMDELVDAVGRATSCAHLFAQLRTHQRWYLVTQGKPLFGPSSSDQLFASSSSLGDDSTLVVNHAALMGGVLIPFKRQNFQQDMTDLYARLGWRMAMQLYSNNATLATHAVVRVLCQHAPPDRCNPIGKQDLEWMRRTLWTIVGNACLSGWRQSIDEAFRREPLYQQLFSCKSVLLH